jgi:hypothetical protein
MIRQNTGVERLRIAFTGMRRYRCLDCEAVFRAVDRRRTPRDEKDVAGAAKRLA